MTVMKAQKPQAFTCYEDTDLIRLRRGDLMGNKDVTCLKPQEKELRPHNF